MIFKWAITVPGSQEEYFNLCEHCQHSCDELWKVNYNDNIALEHNTKTFLQTQNKLTNDLN